jgi:nucleoside-diphosphate-sugar epimerase
MSVRSEASEKTQRSEASEKVPRSEATVAFVAGATGYTGSALVRELRARGAQVIAHVRPDSPSLAEWRARFEGEGAQVDTTPWGGDFAATIRRASVTHVFALLGTTRARARAAAQARKASADYETVDYGLTAELLRAAVASEVAPHFVYLSSIGADRPRGNPYLAARHRLESELRTSGLRYTIARPSFITGPDRAESRAGERVAAAVADGALALLRAVGGTRTHDRYASMTGEALARALASAAIDPAAENATLDSADLRARYGSAAPVR